MGRKIAITTDYDELNLGKIKKKNTEEYLIIKKGQVIELDESMLNKTIMIYLANGNLREAEVKSRKEKPKKDSEKKDSEKKVGDNASSRTG